MKHRDGKGLKRQHSIIEGMETPFTRIASTKGVSAVIPGRIRAVPGSDIFGLRFQYYTPDGFKLMARAKQAVQEVFVITSEPEAVRKHLEASGWLRNPRV